MTTELPTKRRRGGQPGNHNARKNPGNRTERRHRFACGNRLGGAPLANQNARRKRQKRHEIVLADYVHLPEAIDWIRAHAAELEDAAFTADNERDRGLFDGWRGLTPESLAEQGTEYRLGLYCNIDEKTSESQSLESDNVETICSVTGKEFDSLLLFAENEFVPETITGKCSLTVVNLAP